MILFGAEGRQSMFAHAFARMNAKPGSRAANTWSRSLLLLGDAYMKFFRSIIKPASAFSRILYQLIFMVCIGLGSLGFIASEICIRGMMDEAKKNNYLVLRQNQSGIEDDLQRIRTVLIQAGQNRQVKNLISLNADEFNEYNSTTVQDVVMYLNSFRSTIDDINNVWIYQKNADTIISAEGRMNVGTYYSSNCHLEEEVNWEEVYGSRFVTYLGRNAVLKGYSRTPVYIYALTLPLALGYSKGYMAVNVNAAVFEKRFESENNPAGIYVLDENNEIIYMNSAAEEERQRGGTALDYVLRCGLSEEIKEQETVRLGKGGEYALMCIQSAQNGWKYFSLIPTDYIYRKAENIKRACYVMILLSNAVSVLIAFRIILSLNRPVTEILKYARMFRTGGADEKKSGAGSEFTLINDFVSHVYDENEKLKRSIEQTRPFVMEKYLDNLLNGRTEGISESDLAEELGFTRENFQVIVVESDSTGRENRYQPVRDDIREKLSAATAGLEHATIHVLHKNEGDDVYVVNASEGFYSSEESAAFLSRVRGVLDSFDMQYTIGVGRNYRTIGETWLSYVEALQAVKYQDTIGRNAIIFIDEVRDIPEKHIEYPIRRENQLISATKTGNAELTGQILDEIMEDNFKDMAFIPTTFADTLFGSLLTTAYRIAAELTQPEEDLAKQLEEVNAVIINGSLEDKKQQIYALYGTLCDRIAGRRSSKHGSVLEKAVNYIREHYRDSISLAIVAAEVNLSPAYLGYIFKEEMGTNFVDFVNSFRVDRARELLAGTNLTVTAIAEETGFYSYNRFAKVFKKYVGLTPKQYRTGQT